MPGAFLHERSEPEGARGGRNAAATAGLGAGKFDVIIMNPPFHDGRDADPLLGIKFITVAASSMRNGGDLWLVANKHLPYENAMSEAFETSRTVIEAQGFKVLHGSRPKAIMQMHRRRRP